jgi:uncharacterized membrane protein
MMVAIFPANVMVAGKAVEGIEMPGLVVRTTMQVVYIALILLAGYGAPERTQSPGSLQRKSVEDDA